MIKKGQRYQWSDGKGVLEALSDGDGSRQFKIVQTWVVSLQVGDTGFWNINFKYGAGTTLILLEGQDAPIS